LKKRFPAMMFPRGARDLEHPDGGFRDQIVHNNVVVSGEEDASLGPTAYAITADARLITLNANAVEHAISEGVVFVDRGIAAVDENVDLADADGVAGDVNAVGLRDENVGRDSGASCDVGAQTLLVTVLLTIDPAAPKPICTPFCAAPVVGPRPVTTLRWMIARVPFSSAVMPFF